MARRKSNKRRTVVPLHASDWEDGLDPWDEVPVDPEEPPPLEAEPAKPTKPLRKWEQRGGQWYRVDGGRNTKRKSQPPAAGRHRRNPGIKVVARWEKRGKVWVSIREEQVDDNPPPSNSTWGSWWYEKYDYDRRSYSYSADSGSRSWRSKLGGGWNSGYNFGQGGRMAGYAFRRLLGQLQKSANLISTEPLKVRWSNGEQQNAPGEGTIYLSPDGLISDGATSIPDEVVDAMTGKVYIASVLNRTVSSESLEAGSESRKRSKKGKDPRLANCVKLWEAIETAIARKEVEKDWGGFMPYLVSDAARTCATRDDVQKYVDGSAEEPTVEAAITALAWNLVNPADTIKVPEVYGPAIEAAAEAMQDEVAAEGRFDLSQDMVTRVYKALNIEPPPPQSQEEEEDSDGKNEDEGQEEEENGALKVTDSSLFGGQVNNETDSGLANQEAGDDDGTPNGKVSIEDGEGTPSTYSLCDLPRGRGEGFYRDIVRRLNREINAVRQALSFLFVEQGAASFGHRTGDVDDASLYKLRINDDRVMFQRDETSQATLAVCVLIDESGSMYHRTRSGDGQRFELAQDVAVALVEGLKDVPGVTASIYGHTAETHDMNGDYQDGVLLYRYYTPKMPHPAKLAHVSHRSYNHDGYAMQHAANLFATDHRNSDRKIMFVVSDGLPAGNWYGGRPAWRHMRAVSDACRDQLGVEVYGVGIDEAYNERRGREMYGEHHFVVLRDVSSSLGTMVRFLRQAATQMKKKQV